MSKVAIILDSMWKDDSEITLVDNLNRLINVSFQSASANQAVQILVGHEGEISSIDWSSDRAVLISGADDGTVKVGGISGIPKIAMER